MVAARTSTKGLHYAAQITAFSTDVSRNTLSYDNVGQYYVRIFGQDHIILLPSGLSQIRGFGIDFLEKWILRVSKADVMTIDDGGRKITMPTSTRQNAREESRPHSQSFRLANRHMDDYLTRNRRPLPGLCLVEFDGMRGKGRKRGELPVGMVVWVVHRHHHSVIWIELAVITSTTDNEYNDLRDRSTLANGEVVEFISEKSTATSTTNNDSKLLMLVSLGDVLPFLQPNATDQSSEVDTHLTGQMLKMFYETFAVSSCKSEMVLHTRYDTVEYPPWVKESDSNKRYPPGSIWLKWYLDFHSPKLPTTGFIHPT